MKNILRSFSLLILITSMSYALSAQTPVPLSIDVDSIFHEFEVDPNNVNQDEVAKPKNMVTNTSDESVEIGWIVEELSTCKSWEFAICDKVQCYFPGKYEGLTFNLDPDETGEFSMHCYPRSTECDEESQLIAKLFRADVNDSDTTIIFHSFESDGTVSSEEISLHADENYLVVFPNPATDEVSFLNSTDIESISIRSITGKVVAEKNLIPRSKNTISVSNLPRGIYIVHAFDKNNNRIKAIKMKKL